MYIVAIDWRIKPESIDLYRQKITQQAVASVAEEEGCIRFDVAEDPAIMGRFFLYEVYTSEAAFKAHLQMSYSIDFLPLADGMTVSKEVSFFDMVSANGP